MDVEDDNVHIGRMTTDVSGDSGLDCQSEENPMVSPQWMCYFGNIMSYKLTSGRTDIEKVTRKKCEIRTQW